MAVEPGATAVLVTRPGPAGRKLVAELSAAGLDAAFWPAFELLPPSDPGPIAAAAAALGEVDLAIAISPAAARFGAVALPGLANLPALAAVGAGSRAAVAESLQVDPAVVIAPDDADPAGGGAEALWPLLLPRLPACRRALILRAPEGRDWLRQRLADAGVEVIELAVYRRVPVEPAAATAAAVCRRAAAGGAAALVVTSSAAVAVLDAQFARLPGVLPWLQRGVAVASHPRIAERLAAAGYSRRACCAPTAAAIVAALAAPGT